MRKKSSAVHGIFRDTILVFDTSFFFFLILEWIGGIQTTAATSYTLLFPRNNWLFLFYSCLFPLQLFNCWICVSETKSHKCSNICMKNMFFFFLHFQHCTRTTNGRKPTLKCAWQFCFYSHPKEWKQCQMTELINANFRKDYLGSTHM